MPYIDWLGKDDVVHHHKEIAYRTIDCQEVVGDADSENMIIKGDNLLALKSLLPYYANAVKMIYIDPPYNTGNTSLGSIMTIWILLLLKNGSTILLMLMI